MKTILIILLLLCGQAYAQPSSTSTAPGIYIQEQDGDPAARFRTIKVTNDTLTNNGDGSASINTGGGVSGWTDGGTNVYTSTTTDNVGVGTTTPSMRLLVANTDSTTYTTTGASTARLGILNTNTTVNNYSTLSLMQRNSGASDVTGAAIEAVHSVHTASSESSDFVIKTRSAGTLAERVRILGANVGIGTNSPVGAFNVGGSYSRFGIGGTNSNATAVGEVYVQGDLEVDGTIYGDGSQLTGISSGGWADGGTNVYQSATTDAVGIGTTTPTTTLEIVKQSNNHPLMISSVATGDGNYLIVASSGNVGIGTTTDLNAVLTVNGGVSTVGSASLSYFQGNVGVGTINPRALLDVGASGTLNSVGANDVYIQNDLEVDGTVYMGSCSGAGCGGGSSQWQTTAVGIGTTGLVGIGTYGPSGMLEVVKVGTNSPLMISSTATGDGDYMIMMSGGNVGIGTRSPAAGVTLEVKSTGTDKTPIYIRSSDGAQLGGIYEESTTAGTIFVNNGSGVTTINLVGDGSVANSYLNAGNVGIGTTNPRGGFVVMNGNVGIGTWSPQGKLQVTGGGNTGIGTILPRSLLEVQKGTGTAQITIDGTTGACLMLQDTDGAGWTECDALNGTLSCSTDADGICD